ncbi:hypothetical protein CANCADRAFT_77898 [Tortispora caseinolytica NRRL Y-17796]|uniref:RNA exonuclease 3 n=1 Tax=Tortispora caseinolytica NRRL Y-17796 TaxID=767744 RepID=A0A1E4TJF6_9ASCO|nr:hypothetical protein CANCADRAFT_77898 [Tortispora caseinolytica NRRL Y-17796]
MSDPLALKEVYPHPPVVHNIRRSCLESLAQAYRSKNHKKPNSAASHAEFIIATKARNANEYKIAASKQIAAIKKGEPVKAPPRPVQHRAPQDENQHITALKSLIHSLDELKKADYTIDMPGENSEDDDFQSCQRCGEYFSISKPHNECKYHRGKRTKVAERIVYSCCGRNAYSGDTYPCTTFHTHVYERTTPSSLHKVLPFVETEPSSNKLAVLALDCEMAYTSLGKEVTQLSVVNYFTEKLILNVYVKPQGEVWDYVTLYSGVREEDMVNAISLDKARRKLFQLLSPETIIIGHGLENDLNAMRLIHLSVVDTALLYPHRRGPPYKESLKTLSKKYLNKDIQTGEHDPAEDARASLQLVKRSVKLRLSGIRTIV